MGMPKISRHAEASAVSILRSWPKKERMTWEGLRRKIALRRRDRDIEQVWSRQALSANEAISAAYHEARAHLSSSQASGISPGAKVHTLGARVADLERQLDALRKRHEALQIRHAQLVHNASLLRGGAQLLDAPLPDNTRSQSG